MTIYSTNELIAGITNEFRIMKHLGSKVTADNKGHKLTDAQRSIEELEHYIISSFPAQIKLMALGKRDEAVYNEHIAKFEGYTHEQFDTQIDAALQSIITDISSLTEAQRSEEISIRGMTKPRSGFLIDYVFTFLGAYKMQLFLQLKHAGLKDLTTYNLWAGIDHK